MQCHALSQEKLDRHSKSESTEATKFAFADVMLQPN